MTAKRRTLVYMPLSELVPATVNPKLHDLDGIEKSMQRFGYIEPQIMDERTGRLVAGHGRMDTLLAPTSQNKLSSLAFQATRGIKGDEPRQFRCSAAGHRGAVTRLARRLA